MLISLKVKSFIVEAIDKKQAYIKGCKQYAKYISKTAPGSTSLVVKHIEGRDNAMEFTVFTNVNIQEEQKAFCTICKELHCSFYINEEYNCKRCNLKAFLKRARKRLNIAKGVNMKK